MQKDEKIVQYIKIALMVGTIAYIVWRIETIIKLLSLNP